MATVLHIIESLSLGGAARATAAMAKYSHSFAGFDHQIAALCLAKSDHAAASFAAEQGMQVFAPQSQAELFALMSNADIVSLQWWNSPEMGELLRSPLPPARLMAWCHVAGDRPPQVITSKLLDFVDLLVACSPYTYQCEAIQSLPTEERLRRTAMAYGATDFARLSGIQLKPHSGFNIGYIGTVHFLKMNQNYVRMSAAADIPDACFIVCGGGGHEETLRQQSRELGVAHRFDIRGYIEDIRAAIEIFDVYGYPLCEDTYAASELNLQEVMFAGVPPVVFPYGGISQLVINEFTGLVVRSEQEYKEALEYLYHQRGERTRIGDNARQYARQIFGAQNSARKMNECYQKLLQLPKRNRLWGVNNFQGVVESNQALCDTVEVLNHGHERFIDSLGKWADDFKISAKSEDLEQIIAAEKNISECSELLKSSGILPYKRFYPKDPYLLLWGGLAQLYSGDAYEALADLAQAASNGLSHWRVYWYIAMAAKKCGMQDVARNSLAHVLRAAPEFDQARIMLTSLGD